KMAVSAGIGFFITFVGLQGAGIITPNEATHVIPAPVHETVEQRTTYELPVTVILMAKKTPGAIFIGMIVTALAGVVLNLVPMPGGIVSAVPSIEPTFGAAFEAFSEPSQLFNTQFLIVVLTFLFVDFFDTAGTLVGVASQANFIKDNKL